MTAYLKPSFTVPQLGRDPETCSHGWVNDKQQCVFCGVSPIHSWYSDLDTTPVLEIYQEVAS